MKSLSLRLLAPDLIVSLRAREGSDEDAEQTGSLSPLEGLGT